MSENNEALGVTKVRGHDIGVKHVFHEKADLRS